VKTEVTSAKLEKPDQNRGREQARKVWERRLDLPSTFTVASPAPPKKRIADHTSVRTYLRGRVFQEFLSEASHILLSVISPSHKIFPRPPVSPVFDFVQYCFPSELQKGEGSVGF
jgi:hypothetical protein